MFSTKNIFTENSLYKQIKVTKKNCHQNSVFLKQLFQPKKVMKFQFYTFYFRKLVFRTGDIFIIEKMWATQMLFVNATYKFKNRWLTFRFMEQDQRKMQKHYQSLLSWTSWLKRRKGFFPKIVWHNNIFFFTKKVSLVLKYIFFKLQKASYFFFTFFKSIITKNN